MSAALDPDSAKLAAEEARRNKLYSIMACIREVQKRNDHTGGPDGWWWWWRRRWAGVAAGCRVRYAPSAKCYCLCTTPLALHPRAEAMFKPLEDTAALLVRFGDQLEPELVKQLEDGPRQWRLLVKKMFRWGRLVSGWVGSGGCRGAQEGGLVCFHGSLAWAQPVARAMTNYLTSNPTMHTTAGARSLRPFRRPRPSMCAERATPMARSWTPTVPSSCSGHPSSCPLAQSLGWIM